MADILVLDDIQDAANLISKILSKKGHTVHAFTEEDQAIAFAAENTIDLAIVDIKLKEKCGLEVLYWLKRKTPEMRVVMMTGYPTVETVREALRLGAEDYLSKPIDRAQLEKLANKPFPAKMLERLHSCTPEIPNISCYPSLQPATKF